MLLVMSSVNQLLAQSSPSIDIASVPDRIAEGQIDQMLALLKQRVAANPKDAQAHNLLSRVYYAEERWDEAISESEQATRLSPNTAMYHLWLGRAYGLKAEHVIFVTAIPLARKVRREFQAATDLEPDSSEVRSDLGEYFVEAPGFLGGGLDRARDDAAALAKIDEAASHWLLGRVAEKASDPQEAEKQYRAAIASSKGPAGRWIDLATFFRRQKRFDDMQDAINQAISLDKQKTPVYLDSAVLLEEAGRNRPIAIRLLQEYISSGHKAEQASVLRARMLLGKLLEKNGDKSAAAEQYRALLANARDFSPARKALQDLE